jgi:cob(I)alamin adenosyltransferase
LRLQEIQRSKKMNTGKIEIIYGEGSGKTAMALGKGLGALARQQRVTVIQFLKGNQTSEILYTFKNIKNIETKYSYKVEIGLDNDGKLTNTTLYNQDIVHTES